MFRCESDMPFFFFNGGSREITLTVPLRRLLGLIWTLWTPPQPPYHDLVQRQYSLFINKTNNINDKFLENDFWTPPPPINFVHGSHM